MPGPRKLPIEVRLALSKLDLKMKLMPSRAGDFLQLAGHVELQLLAR
jgi:hypothetical protein